MPTTPLATPVVAVDRLRVMRGGALALSVDHLELDRGLISLVGPNGSGKSTLLHVLAGLLAPAAGSVRVLGTSPDAARRRVAYVLQSQHPSGHVPVTAREVVALGRAASLGPFRRLTTTDRRLVDDAMARLEVADLADRHLSEMSGGQCQRVLIAQGLVQDADVLLLDEPVAGLDVASIATIRRELDVERRAGRTIVVATHDLTEAAASDQAVLLAGRVVAAGAPVEVLVPDRLREAYEGRILDLGGMSVALDDGAHHGHDHVHDHLHDHVHTHDEQHQHDHHPDDHHPHDHHPHA